MNVLLRVFAFLFTKLRNSLMNEQFWRNAPKIFADNANVAVMRGIGNTFLLALNSGQNATVFAFTPEHMKRFSQMVLYEVGQYEKTNGEIKIDAWAPGMMSPYSVKGPDEGKK